ncbi:MAG: hypothetical protein AAF078_11400, partial [Planctomycetota bacterium]
MSTTDAKPNHQGGVSADTRRLLTSSGLHVLLAVVALTMVLPFVWMVLTSLKPLEEVGLESWIPSAFQWKNYAILFGLG